ncbi:DUF4340 domain-containing protein [Lachnospiraceae bacterium NSJ-143]|nr:DUF4340 domain-containing protein [Lachnospiraceae bacterium NSJ-143]
MSSQKTRLIIGLIAVVVVVGGFALSRSYSQKKQQQQVQQEEKKTLLEKSDAAIKKYVVSKDGQSVVFNKQENTDWAIEGYENADLMQISIDQAIAYMGDLEYSNVIEGGMEKPADYGLENGITDEAYDEAGNLVYKVTVGSKTVDESGYYAAVDSSGDVYIISADAGKALSYPPDSFRDKYPEYVDYSDIKEMSVKIRDGLSYSIVPNPDGEITSGYGEYLLTGAYSFDIPVLTDKLAENIGGPFYEITASGFIDKPEADSVYGLDNPVMVLSASDNQGRECTITVGNDAGEGLVYARFSGKDYICTVSKEKTDKIHNARLFDIIGKHYINESAEAFSEITVKDKDFEGTYSIDSENSSVTLNGNPADMSTFTEIYKSIAAVTMDGEMKNTPGEYVGELVLSYKNGDVLTLRFLEYDDNFYAVERNGKAEFITGKRNLLQITEAVKTLI